MRAGTVLPTRRGPGESPPALTRTAEEEHVGFQTLPFLIIFVSLSVVITAVVMIRGRSSSHKELVIVAVLESPRLRRPAAFSLKNRKKTLTMLK